MPEKKKTKKQPPNIIDLGNDFLSGSKDLLDSEEKAELKEKRKPRQKPEEILY